MPLMVMSHHLMPTMPVTTPDINVAVIQYGALLNVQLKVGGDFAGVSFCLGNALGVAAKLANTFADGQAAMAHYRQCLGAELATHAAAAGKATLLVGEIPLLPVGGGWSLRCRATPAPPRWHR